MKKIVRKDSQQNQIHIYLYEPESKPKGVLHIVHGASEHLARYGLLAEFMNKNGYAVIGCDMLGHGLSTDNYDQVHFSDRDPGKVAFESLLLVKEYIEENLKGIPVYLLGHSMGSFAARKLLLDYPGFYKKAIISGSAYRPRVFALFGFAAMKLIALFKGMNYVSPFLQNLSTEGNPKRMRKEGLIGDLNEEWLTRDEQVQQYYHNSNMCGQPFTVDANIAMLTWLDYASQKKNIKKGNYDQPILLASGSQCPVGNYGKEILALQATLKKLGYKHVTAKIYEGFRHEVHNEIGKEVVFEDYLKFIQE